MGWCVFRRTHFVVGHNVPINGTHLRCGVSDHAQPVHFREVWIVHIWFFFLSSCIFSTKMECIVCTLPCENCIIPCQHVICESCAHTWFKRSCTCPVCRQPPASLSLSSSPSENSIVIRTFDDLGLTLMNNTGKTGGVRVQKVVEGESAQRSGLRVGDVFSHVNDIQVYSHTQAMAILEQSVKCKFQMTISLCDGPSCQKTLLFSSCLPSRYAMGRRAQISTRVLQR